MYLSKPPELSKGPRPPLGAPIQNSWFSVLTRYLEEPLDASCEFLDAELEGRRSIFVEALRKFCHMVGQWTFPRDVGEGFWLPNELKYGDNYEYRRRALEIDIASIDVIDAYKELVRQGRRKLGVDVAPGA
jgi:hypothetical protein